MQIFNKFFWLRAVTLLAFVGVVLAMVAGCTTIGNLQSIQKDLHLVSNDKAKGVLIDIKQRAILSHNREDDSKLIVCAEPSPDALSSYAAGLNLSDGDSQASGILSESSAFTGLRTQTIQLLRDSLFRLCESYLSGAITRQQFALLMSRYQKNMVAFLAIEQLTGTARPHPINVTSPNIVIENTTTVESTPSSLSYNYNVTVNSGGARDMSVIAGAVQTIALEILKQTEIENSLLGSVPSSNGNTPLHSAARDGHLDLVKSYIKSDAIDVNIRNRKYQTPLHLAALASESPQVVSILINKWAKVNVKDENQYTPLHVAVISPNKDNSSKVEILNLILSHKEKIDLNAKDEDGNTPLHLAVLRNNRDIVNALLDVSVNLNIKNNDRYTPLHLAVKEGYIDIVNTLITVRKINLNIQGKIGYTPLHLAAYYNHMDIVTDLLDASVNPNIINDNRETPLHLAVKQEGGYIVNALLGAKVNVDPNIGNKGGDTPLHLAVFINNVEIVEALITVRNISLNVQNKDGDTPLHLAVSRGHRKIVRVLIDKGVKPDMQNEKIICEKWYELFKDICETDSNKSQRSELLILSKIKDVDLTVKYDNENTLLHWAAQDGNITMVVHILTLSITTNVVNEKNRYGKTPLHLAVLHNNIEVVSILVTSKAISLDAQDIDGNTPLHLAVSHGYIDIVTALLKAGADVDKKNKDGNTPAHLAVLDGYKQDILNVLIEKGADLSMGNKKGLTTIYIITEILRLVYNHNKGA